MGRILDKLTGTKRPAEGTPRSTPEELRAALLAVAGPDDPYRVTEGGPKNADLTAEWRIDEPTWSTTFSQKDVSHVIKIMMKLDDEAGEVRSIDQTYTVTWRAGVAQLSITRESHRGQTKQVAFRKEIGVDGTTRTTWSFSSDELKDPLRDAALQRGWGWKGLTFGKL